MRVPHPSLSARLFAVLITLLLVFGPGSAAFAQMEEGDAGATTSADDTSAEASETAEVEATADGGDTTVTDDAPADDAADDEAADEDAAAEETAEAAADDAGGAEGDDDGVVVITSQPEDSRSGGANDDGPYTSDPDAPETASGNGSDDDNGQQPCAGCVGDADDKNPPGQLPGPDEDGDVGNECDPNEGVGQSNPAHTSCQDAPELVPDIELVKAGASTAEPGDVVTYTFKVTNTGETALTNVTVNDPKLGGTITLAKTTLAVGEFTTGSATYTVTQADATAGKVDNTATATGTPPTGSNVTDTDDHTFPVTDAPGDIDVDADCEGFTVTSSKDISNIIIEYRNADGTLGTFKLDGLSGKTFTGVFADYIPAGATVTAVYVKSGSNASGDYPGAGERFEVGGDCDLPAAIELVKTGSSTAEIGEEITYNFVVTNTGEVQLTDVTLIDPLLGGSIDLEDTTLDPGESTTGTATYTVLLEDIDDDGKLRNTATTTGTPPTGPDVTDTDNHIVDISPFGPAGIQIVKTGPATAEVGEAVTYTMEVTNTEAQRLRDVVVTDPSCDAGTLTGPVKTGGDLDASLEPGEVWTYECTRVMQAGDVPSHTNVATVNATSPVGPVTDDDDHVVTIPVNAPVPEITLEKTGPAAAELGETITYNFKVTNTGETILTNVKVNDPKLGGNITLADTTLEPGESTTGTATYTITEADATAGKVDNTATATGTPPSGPDVTDTDGHTVLVSTPKHTFCHETKPFSNRFIVLETSVHGVINGHYGDHHHGGRDVIPPFVYLGEQYPGQNWDAAGQAFYEAQCVTTPAISIDKEASVESAEVGEQVLYSFVVTNTGELDLINVVIDDARLGIVDLPVTTAANPVLSVGEAVTVFAPNPYTITEADLEDGEVENTAVTTGETEDGEPVTDDDTDAVEVTDLPGSIIVEFDCTGFKVTSSKDIDSLTIVLNSNGTESSITLPDDAVTSPFTYTAPAGSSVVRVFVKSGDVPPGSPDTGQEFNNDAACVPAITLEKTGVETAEIGEEITYDFLITNTGDVRLTNVTLTDPLLGGPIDIEDTTLDPDESTTGTATYTVLLEDIDDDGVLRNLATTTGTPPTGPNVSDTDPHDVDISPFGPAGIQIVKDGPPTAEVGETVTYTMDVTNTEVQRLRDVVVTDPDCDAGTITGPVKTGGDLDNSLEPGEVWSYTCTRVMQPGDAPSHRNVATVNATSPIGPVTDDDDHIVTIPVDAPAPSISLVKDGPATAIVGGVITYTFDVTNTGNTTLTNVHVTDPLLGGAQIPVTPSTLAPGQSGEATGTYTVKAADGVAGTIHNVATATGTPPTGPNVTDTDPHDVDVPGGVIDDRPDIELIKDGPAEAAEGDTITYTFRVENTGNTRLTNVHITDPLLGNGSIAVTPSTLQPGGVGNATATYTITAADALAGEVLNTATATGTPPSGPDVEDDDDHEVLVPVVTEQPDPGIELTKLSSVEEAEVGDVIEYSFRVKNTGNTILTNVHITDPLLGAGVIAVRPSTLDPGEIGVAGPIAYTVTEADAEAGEVLNTAVATGTPPDGPPVEDEDDNVVIVPPFVPEADEPGIRLVKQGPATAQRGDTVTYTFTVTNTGNVVLRNVHISDPLLGLEDLAVTPSTLAAGESGTATATYTVRARDVARGFILNTATAFGNPPNGPPVNDDDDHRIEVPGVPPPPPPITPPATPDLPATGSDALTQLLAGMMALLLGMFLVRRASNLQTATAYSPDANGFARRRPQATDSTTIDGRGTFRRRT